MNRIEKKFKELRRVNKKAFIAFITCGYPNLEITERLILEFDRIGVDILELGVPFSDPLADGPIIQESSEVALKNRTNLNDILNLVRRLRKNIDMPICLMSYYNPVFCFGEQGFVRKATQAGVDGIIIPDLPPEEARSFIRLSNRFNLDTILFISPTTSLARIKLISQLSKGFIYYVSLTGVTGLREVLSPEISQHLKMIKGITNKPVCVGFGISTPEQVRQISGFADGVIVGSAIIKKIKENMGKLDLIKKIGLFVQGLSSTKNWK